MPLLGRDLILNDAIILTCSLLLRAFIDNCARKMKKGKQDDQDQDREKLSTVEETRVEASSKKMLQIDFRVDKVKPVSPCLPTRQDELDKKKRPQKR